MAQQYDAIIIGGGHNGLVCGAYPAKAGLKTRVLERRHVIAGAAVSDKIVPGASHEGWGFVRGGMGTISKAIAASGTRFGSRSELMLRSGRC
jgi:phytoene dehydrogenase-like protein